MDAKPCIVENPFDSDLTERITINVGGFRHNTFMSTLKNIPDTRLSWLAENHTNCVEYDQVLGEYFFDRHPRIFAEVLNYYRTGKLHCPGDVCSTLFQEELSYWGINDRDMEQCCWAHYKRQINTEETLKSFHLDSARKMDGKEKSGKRKSLTTIFAKEESFKRGFLKRWNRFRPKVWAFLDDPHSSKASWVFIMISCLMILVSVTQFCLGTVPSLREDSFTMKVLYWLDFSTSIWFTVEFVLRLVFCPSTKEFAKNPMNWVDLTAILPFYFRLFKLQDQISWLVVMRTLRIFRIFSLSLSFQILFRSLISSKNELFLVFVSVMVPIILFSSMIYFAEKDANDKNFQSIPESFWWAIITVTTVGYGDVCPVTKLGKVIGAVCAICGVVIVALPVSVIGSNFSYYYIQARTRVQQPRRANNQHQKTISHVPANIMGLTRRSTMTGSPDVRMRKRVLASPVRKRLRRMATNGEPGRLRHNSFQHIEEVSNM
uniref:ShawR1 n=2 Tax=Nematostella vectensis TaxID=45351 RepID=A0A0C5GFJ1_NEMVE|nr:ShawR1 [Nematostella vectensis]